MILNLQLAQFVSVVMQIQKKLDQAEADQKATETSSEPIDSGCETLSEEEDSVDLWVEKYKPKSYLELLSDEVNGLSSNVPSDSDAAQDVQQLVDNYNKFIKLH
jgi:hypothetical protein